MIRVLFVCMGNICRSPIAEGTFRQLLKEQHLHTEFEVDSAGTIGYHAGSAPDHRAQKTARQHHIDISAQRSRKVTDQDFLEFDYILAMDRDNYADLKNRCPSEYQTKINLFLDHAHTISEKEMPDPYYGGQNGFEYCIKAAAEASKGLLDHIKATQGLG